MNTKPPFSPSSESGAHKLGQAAGEPRQPDRPESRRHEGLWVGLIGATGVWLSLLVSDTLARQPFRTPALLGRDLLSLDAPGARFAPWAGVLAFTVAHYALWILVGVLAVRAVRAARRTPAVLLFALFIFILLQFLFIAITAILAEGRLGTTAWRDMLIGNAVGWAAALWYILRRHRELRAELGRSSEGDS